MLSRRQHLFRFRWNRMTGLQPAIRNSLPSGSIRGISETRNSSHTSNATEVVPAQEQEDALKYTLEKIDQIVKESDVVIFMKGKPNAPECGYSRAAANLLSKYAVSVAAVDVLENELVRHAIKKYSSWPTIPQVFIKGEFVGGSDILMQAHENGELSKLFEKHGLVSEDS